MASTDKGANRIGMTMGKHPAPTDFFKEAFPDSELLENHEANQGLEQVLTGLFWNQNVPENPKLDVSCTPFQWSAMKAIAQIPFGETRTYAQVAVMLHKPKGARAVGGAMGRNPLPLLYP